MLPHLCEVSATFSYIRFLFNQDAAGRWRFQIFEQRMFDGILLARGGRVYRLLTAAANVACIFGCHCPPMGGVVGLADSNGSNADNPVRTAAGADFASVANMPRLGSIRLLILCGVLLIASIAVGTAVMVGNFRERTLTNTERELENTVTLLGRHFEQQLDDFQVIQNDIIAYMQSAHVDTSEVYRRQMSTIDVHRVLKAKLSAMSYVGGVNLFDADGRLINSSEAWPVPEVDIADRTFFKALKFDPLSAPVLAESVQSRVTGARTLVIAHKLTGSKSEFIGVIGRGIEPAYFEKYFESLALGEGAAIALLHLDGTLLARHPNIEAMIGRNFKTSPLFRNILSKADHGTIRLDSRVDGQDRLASVRKLGHFPIAVVASKTTSGALADWRQQTRFLVGAAVAFALVIAFVFFMIVRQWSREHASSAQILALEKHSLDVALNNMTQGLLLYDSSAKIVVCNSRYIEMYGLSPEVVKRGCSLRELFAHRKATGSFDGDVDEYCSNVLRDMGKVTRKLVQNSDGRSVQVSYQPLETGGWVTMVEDVTERKHSEEQIAYLAHHDALTGLVNRSMFSVLLNASIESSRRHARQFAVLFVDLDRFKIINDTLGHAEGDTLLIEIAKRLREIVRAGDVVARLGGDEFVVILQEIAEHAEVATVAEKLLLTIKQPILLSGQECQVTASIGVAMFPADGTDEQTLTKNADMAMYLAKEEGKNDIRFFSEDLKTQSLERLVFETSLRHAIERNEFVLYYQPKRDLLSGQITGVEALVRWAHPEFGILQPNQFIPLAEETGLIIQIGQWVLKTACEQNMAWQREGFPPISMAVNISPREFANEGLLEYLDKALAESGMPAELLQLEITESMVIYNVERTAKVLFAIKGRGVRLAMHDFGAGYSSMSLIKQFPVDTLKIDRSFVRDLPSDSGDKVIAEAIIRLGKALGLTIVAEGVETTEQETFLREHACDEMQGFLLSKAVPAAEMPLFFQSCWSPPLQPTEIAIGLAEAAADTVRVAPRRTG